MKKLTPEERRVRNAATALCDHLQDMDKLERENAALRAELEAQAVVNGKGGEREAKLLAENAALRADKERLDWLDERIVRSWLDGKDFVIWDKCSAQPCSIREWLDNAMKENP